MQLVNEKDNLSITIFYFLKNCLQTLFKFSTILCTCDQSSHIQGENCLVLQPFRYISADNPLCKSFYNCCLTNTRFTDQNRIVLRLTGQDTDHIPNLFVTSDHRIQLLLSGSVHQILTIFI